ncbi:TetR/AcrR family transcriptional regulator [Nitrospirillum sp. BR 11164]|uniref:TetR/AcrR family transcriptional regulator n=1 Tax=Nitrospirillum sp. BR 11164 TaxID=3104324 RepID=UPI002AFDDEBB|nr:TetR/AcrR family transcriptional regulator [Nitrospirillum sp. BR 11164]MEA1652901.1 TetR/AcrR family transcriptional regulator [Nitrospirillum sp. BR 11164]
MIQRLVDAAHQHFNERGYAATTTKDIAATADVSETLLYRHFGSKAGLFDQVVFNPFDHIAQQFLNPTGSGPGLTLDLAVAKAILDQFLTFLDGNNRLLRDLLVKGGAETADEGNEARLAGMRHHYGEAARQLRALYQAADQPCPLDPDIAVRLALGMVIAASVMGDWLFPDGAPDRELLAANIKLMMIRALAPGKEAPR